MSENENYHRIYNNDAYQQLRSKIQDHTHDETRTLEIMNLITDGALTWAAGEGLLPITVGYRIYSLPPALRESVEDYLHPFHFLSEFLGD